MDKEKKKKDFESPFIPISDLGMSEEGFCVDVAELYTALYESYSACCHNPQADKTPSSETDFGKDEPLNHHQMSTVGRAGQFMWYSLSSLFDESIHQMNDFKRTHNNHHLETVSNPIESPSDNLLHAINNDEHLVNLCRKPLVLNVTEYNNYYGNNYGAYGNYLNYFHQVGHFFGVPFTEGVFEHIEKEDGKKYIRIKPELIKGKDVIIPQIIATRQTIDIFKRIAMFVCKNGANSAIGLFITRIKPTADGIEPKKVADKYGIQPLGPRFFGGLGIPVV